MKMRVDETLNSEALISHFIREHSNLFLESLKLVLILLKRMYVLVSKEDFSIITTIGSEKSDQQIKVLFLRCQCICQGSLFSISDDERVSYPNSWISFPFTHLLPASPLLSLLALAKKPALPLLLSGTVFLDMSPPY